MRFVAGLRLQQKRGAEVVERRKAANAFAAWNAWKRKMGKRRHARLVGIRLSLEGERRVFAAVWMRWNSARRRMLICASAKKEWELKILARAYSRWGEERAAATRCVEKAAEMHARYLMSKLRITFSLPHTHTHRNARQTHGS